MAFVNPLMAKTFFLITDFEEQKNYKVITEFEG